MSSAGEYAEYNSWIDPLIPHPEITIGGICQNLITLFEAMKNDTNNYKPGTDDIPFEYYLVKVNTLM